MSDGEDQHRFRTLRGFLAGWEPDEPITFAYSATLRIFGAIPSLDEITRRLGVAPTDSHRRGERLGPNSPLHESDLWSYEPPIPESEPLNVHIDALWATVRPHTRYLLDLKRSLTVDVFLGYRSNCDTAGIEVPAASLEMFTALQIPFGLSIIVA